MSAEKPMSGAVEAMPTEMELRVAKALDDLIDGWFDDRAQANLNTADLARVAIRAMLRPTDAMLAAGAAADEALENAAPETAVHIIYSDMIKAATAPIQESSTAAVPLVPASRQSP